MIQTATKLAYGAAPLVLSFLLAVPLRAADTGKVFRRFHQRLRRRRTQRQDLAQERNSRPRRNDLVKVEIT